MTTKAYQEAQKAIAKALERGAYDGEGVTDGDILIAKTQLAIAAEINRATTILIESTDRLVAALP